MCHCLYCACLCATQFPFFMLFKRTDAYYTGMESEGADEMLLKLSYRQYLQYMHITFISVHVSDTLKLMLDKFLQTFQLALLFSVTLHNI